MQEVQRHDFIDALRGVAILGVILVHSSGAVAPHSPYLQSLMSYGARGVQLFYVVSAFALCMSWKERRLNEVSPLRNFYIRRFFRIAPLFYVAIGFYLLLYGFSPRYWAPNGVEWWFVVVTALFLHGFHPETITSVVPGGWSIAVEMNFYLLLPIFLIHFCNIRAALLLFVSSLTLYLVFRTLLLSVLSPYYPESQHYLVTGFIFLNFMSHLPVFAMGLVAFLVISIRELPHPVRVYIGIAALAIAAYVLAIPSSGLILGNHISSGVWFALILLWLRRSPIKLIVNGLTTGLGKISFSMYLVSFAVMEAFSRLGITAEFSNGDASSIFHFMCILGVTALLSFVSYMTIERGGVRIGRKVIEGMEWRQRVDRREIGLQ